VRGNEAKTSSLPKVDTNEAVRIGVQGADKGSIKERVAKLFALGVTPMKWEGPKYSKRVLASRKVKADENRNRGDELSWQNRLGRQRARLVKKEVSLGVQLRGKGGVVRHETSRREADSR